MRLPDYVSEKEGADVNISAFGGLVPPETAGAGDVVEMRGISAAAAPALAPRLHESRFAGISKETEALFVNEEALVALKKQDGRDRLHIWCPGDAEPTQAQLWATPSEGSCSNRGTWLGERLYLPARGTIVSTTERRSVPMKKFATDGAFLMSDIPIYGSPLHAIGIFFGQGVQEVLSGEYLKCHYQRKDAFFETLIRVDRMEDYAIYADLSALEPIQELSNIEVCDIWPDQLQQIFLSSGRTWGFSEHSVYASARNLPCCWETPDGTDAQDGAFALHDVPHVGRILAGADLCGEPILFGTEGVVRIAGDSPQSFRVEPLSDRGMDAQSAASLVKLSDALYYASREGICVCSEGNVKPVTALLPFALRGVCAQTDGRCYHMQGVDAKGQTRRYYYDPESKLCYEDTPFASSLLARAGNALLGLSQDGLLAQSDRPFDSALLGEMCTFSPFGYAKVPACASVRFGKRALSRGERAPAELEVVAELAAGARGEREREHTACYTLTGPLPYGHYHFRIRRLRAKHYRLVISGKGEWRVHGLRAH